MSASRIEADLAFVLGYAYGAAKTEGHLDVAEKAATLLGAVGGPSIRLECPPAPPAHEAGGRVPNLVFDLRGCIVEADAVARELRKRSEARGLLTDDRHLMATAATVTEDLLTWIRAGRR